MKYSERIEHAIRFAAKKHNGQLRKDSDPLPYVTHLFSAALLVSEVTGDEDVIVATLLHDTIEDTATSDEEIRTQFGARVSEMVRAVTLPRERDGIPMSWHEQRAAGFEILKAGPKEAILVALADKVHNGLSRIMAFRAGDAAITKKFNARRDDYIAHNRKMLELANERVGENELTRKLEELISIEETL